jgi:hypothetical protein
MTRKEEVLAKMHVFMPTALRKLADGSTLGQRRISLEDKFRRRVEF